MGARGYNPGMAYLIDGHNLIPKLGIDLGAEDDEEQLVRVLQEFCRVTRKQGEVYFDGRAPGQAATQKAGRVTAHFVRPPRTADEALEERLQKLGAAAKNWTLVSSDHRVQAAGREAHAKVVPAEVFAREVRAKIAPHWGSSGSPNPPNSSNSGGELSSEELGEWLEIFKKK
jgi:predicted RNA-binding protein with PIN domain